MPHKGGFKEWHQRARLKKDTVLADPGERYDVVWIAQQPGK
jgi:hypothetical protein